MAATRRLLVDFGLDPAAQAGILAATAAGARRHLDRPAAVSRDTGRGYRAERQHIVGLLTGAEPLPAALGKALDTRSEVVAPLMQDLRRLDEGRALWRSPASILPSFVHMGLNRLFAQNQRRHEFVVVDLLARGYREIAARMGGDGPASASPGG